MTYDKDMTQPHAVSAASCRPMALAEDLRVATTRAVRRIRQERSSEQITDAQYAALAALANRGPMSPTALADDQKVQPPHITRVINALVTAGLARRDEHATDRRQVVVSITDAGLLEVKETRRRRNEWLAGRLGHLDAADREALAQAVVLLRRLTDE
jgi:DNA-binding MarR family transcriptional regulator